MARMTVMATQRSVKTWLEPDISSCRSCSVFGSGWFQTRTWTFS